MPFVESFLEMLLTTEGQRITYEDYHFRRIIAAVLQDDVGGGDAGIGWRL
jgi:hypothetical protein